MKQTVFFLFVASLLFSCTPKTADQTKQEQTPPPTAEEVKCRTFDKTVYRDDALDNYTIYRDRLRANKFEEALSLWRFVHEKAPDADGKRTNVYTDGVKIYAHLYEQTSDPTLKAAYFDTISSLYEETKRCYDKPKDNAYLSAVRAFDAYYSFSDQISPDENYALFLQAFKGYEQDDTPAFLINPFTALMVDQFLAEKIEMTEAKKWANYIVETVARKKEILSSENYQREGWDIVENYVPQRLEGLEGEEGFYDCSYYINKYMAEFQKAPTDCENLQTVYGRLRWGGCEKESAEVQQVWAALQNNNCIKQTETKTTVAGQAFSCLQEGDYRCAVDKFTQAGDESSDNAKKARYYFLVAKIYYAHLKRFSSARSFALKAAQYRSGWGDPYILIGKLYASSGPLCGSGRGWNSQVVTWPAIDKWQYARSIDGSVAAEANRLIGQYSQYMPSRGDIFQRNLQEGSAFTVGCWINESTTIRAAPR